MKRVKEESRTATHKKNVFPKILQVRGSVPPFPLNPESKIAHTNIYLIVLMVIHAMPLLSSTQASKLKKKSLMSHRLLLKI